MDSHRTKQTTSASEPAHRSVPVEVDLEQIWLAVAGEVWASPPHPLERLLVRVLRSPGLARALVTTPSLVLSWIAASAAVLAAGVLATAGTGEPWPALFAPALAGAGVAYAYGPGIDPAYELSRSMAVPDRLVLLARALGVFGVNAVLGLAATLVSAPAAGITLGWLLPMTAISALALAAATLARSAGFGMLFALACWTTTVVGSAGDAHDLTRAVHSEELMPLYLTATVAGIVAALLATSNLRWMGARQWR